MLARDLLPHTRQTRSESREELCEQRQLPTKIENALGNRFRAQWVQRHPAFVDEAKEDHLRTEHDGEREESDAEQHIVEQRHRAEVRGDTITSRLSTTSAADIDSSHQNRAKRETNYRKPMSGRTPLELAHKKSPV